MLCIFNLEKEEKIVLIFLDFLRKWILNFEVTLDFKVTLNSAIAFGIIQMLYLKYCWFYLIASFYRTIKTVLHGANYFTFVLFDSMFPDEY